MQEQERYEQQLYQLSQRLMLQSQLNDQQALERQAEQQLAATRQGLESALQALALSLPAEGTEAAWLHARESEFAQWQAQQTQHDAIQQQIAALRPLLETLPTSDETEVEAESAIPDNWREIHEGMPVAAQPACRPAAAGNPGKGASGPVAGAIHLRPGRQPL